MLFITTMTRHWNSAGFFSRVRTKRNYILLFRKKFISFTQKNENLILFRFFVNIKMFVPTPQMDCPPPSQSNQCLNALINLYTSLRSDSWFNHRWQKYNFSSAYNFIFRLFCAFWHFEEIKSADPIKKHLDCSISTTRTVP